MAYNTVLLCIGFAVLIPNEFSYASDVTHDHNDPHVENELHLPSLEPDILALLLVVRYVQNYKKYCFAVGGFVTRKWGLQIHNTTVTGIIKMAGLIFYCVIWVIVVAYFKCARYGNCSTTVPTFFQTMLQMICSITSNDRVLEYLMQTPGMFAVLLSEIASKYVTSFETPVDFSEDNNMHVWCTAAWVDLAKTKQFGVDYVVIGDRLAIEENNDDIHSGNGEPGRLVQDDDEALNENEEPRSAAHGSDEALNGSEEPGSHVQNNEDTHKENELPRSPVQASDDALNGSEEPGSHVQNNDDAHKENELPRSPAQGSDDALNGKEELCSPARPVPHNDSNVDDGKVKSQVLDGDDKLNKEIKSNINPVMNLDESGHISGSQQEDEINVNSVHTPSTSTTPRKPKKPKIIPPSTRSSKRLEAKRNSVPLNS